MKKKFSLIILFFVCWNVATAQVTIGSNDEPGKNFQFLN